MYALVPLALAALAAANPMLQSRADSTCSENYDGTFEIEVVNQTTTSKRALEQVS